MLLFWLATASASADECRAALSDARRAWRDLAVPVPVGADLGDRLDATLDTVVDHGAIDVELTKGRKKSNRAELPATFARANTWLDANPDAKGLDVARAALSTAASACAGGS